MPGPVLIVEDEQSAARLLGQLCSDLGLQVQTTRSGREALELCARAADSGSPFSCVILDLVLAELDGFQVATGIRARPWGAQLPLVVMSAVYKNLPAEFAARAKPTAFFPKPFEPSALRETLTKVCGIQGSPSIEGDLAQKPVATLFVELLQKKANGTLTLVRDTSKRVLTFQGGAIRYAQSNVKSETVGAAQVASGLIKQASFDRAVAMARQQKIALYEALATARVLTPDQLKIALKQQTTDVAMNALSWSDGTHRFDPSSQEAMNATPDARVSPVALILDWARKNGTAAQARPWLEARAQERTNRTPELERELFVLRATWPNESVSPVATGGRSLGEVLARLKEPELPLLHALCLSGLISLSGGPKSIPKPHPGAPPGAGDEDRGKVFAAAESNARRMLFGESDHLKDASHYEVLGVPTSAGNEEIRKAYFVQAKRFHSDTFSGLELGSARKVSEELFQRVNEASSVLTDKEKRAEYDVFLDRKAKGLPTDVAAILRAEGIFQKGEAVFKLGKWEDAEALFREAIALNHAEAEFHAYLGMAMFRSRGKAEDALPHVEKSLELDPRLRSGTLFAAALYDAAGDQEKAKTVLRKAVEKDPDFVEAKSKLQALRTKPVGPSKKAGFFGRLLKK